MIDDIDRIDVSPPPSTSISDHVTAQVRGDVIVINVVVIVIVQTARVVYSTPTFRKKCWTGITGLLMAVVVPPLRGIRCWVASGIRKPIRADD